MAQGLIFLELATTGSDPRFHELWEIAYIRRRQGKPDEEWIWQYRPETLAQADPAALRAGRYYERMACPTSGTVEAISGAAAAAAESHNTLNHPDDRSRDDWVDLKRRLSRPVLASLLAAQLEGATIVTTDPVRTAGFLAAFLHPGGEAGSWAAIESITSRIGGYRAAAGEPIRVGASPAAAFHALGVLDDPDRVLSTSAQLDLTRRAWDQTSTAISIESPAADTEPDSTDTPAETADPDEADDGPAF